MRGLLLPILTKHRHRTVARALLRAAVRDACVPSGAAAPGRTIMHASSSCSAAWWRAPRASPC